MSWNQPVYDKQGRFIGTIASGATPADMTAYLQSLLPDKSYALLLIDDNNRIVARSGNQHKWQQDPPIDSKAYLGAAVADVIFLAYRGRVFVGDRL